MFPSGLMHRDMPIEYFGWPFSAPSRRCRRRKVSACGKRLDFRPHCGRWFMPETGGRRACKSVSVVGLPRDLLGPQLFGRLA